MNSILSGAESVDLRIMSILHIHVMYKYVGTSAFFLISTLRNPTQQNGCGEVTYGKPQTP